MGEAEGMGRCCGITCWMGMLKTNDPGQAGSPGPYGEEMAGY